MKEKPDIGILDLDCLNAAWGDIVTLLEKHGLEFLQIYSLRELYAGVSNGQYEVWMVTRGEELKLIAFCGFERHDNKSYYHVLWVGGEGLEDVKTAVSYVEQYACLRGASELVLGGRKGWGRALKKLGFVPHNAWVKPVGILWKH